MSEIKQCDRCKKLVEAPNEIGVVLSISRFMTREGYIRPPKKLLDATKESGWEGEYFPLAFTEKLGGAIDLCAGCFKEFMDLKVAPEKEINQP